MTTPNTPLHAFLSRIIDYAGLYPPASLPLEEAFRNFVQYQDQAEAWMLSRFVIPAKRLAELSPLLAETDKPLSFTLLGRGGKDAADFPGNLELDLRDIHASRSAHGERVILDMFEVALPVPAFEDRFALNTLVKECAERLNLNGLTVFFESPFGEGWNERANKLFYALRKVKDKHVGFKLRTGGVTADAFPTTEQVAWAIVEARDSGIPIKCTAGLHHPVRHFNGSVQTKMHGFLNVFGAGVLASVHAISQETVQTILEDEEPQNFSFDESGFSWKDLHAANSELERTRHSVTSFGSCSFDEPREDLKQLGILK